MFLNPLKGKAVAVQKLGRKSIIMESRNYLAKLSSRPGELLSPMGGAATSAYFKCQHIKLYHQKQRSEQASSISKSVDLARQFHCSCQLSNSSAGGSGDHQHSQASRGQESNQHQQEHIDPELKAKLDDLKDKLEKNAYFDKYREKFQRMELTSPRELLAKLEQLDNRQVKGQVPPPKRTRPGGPSHTKGHALKDVMEVDLLMNLPRDDVVYLWQEFHRKKDGLLGVVMSGSVFEKMADLATKYNMFVMPLPRQHGYEFYFVQYMNKAFHFTPLIAYQAHQENAPESLRLINYTDLQSSKDLVLMRGEYDKNLMTPVDAHIMAVQTNFYYGETSESRQRLLETFFTKPDSFHHMDLVEEFKKLQEKYPNLLEFDGAS